MSGASQLNPIIGKLWLVSKARGAGWLLANAPPRGWVGVAHNSR